MISPHSDLKVLDSSIKLFNVSYDSYQREQMRSIKSELDQSLPDEILYDLHFFKDGSNLYGEAVIDTNHGISIKRVMGGDLLDVADKLKDQILESDFLNQKISA